MSVALPAMVAEPQRTRAAADNGQPDAPDLLDIVRDHLMAVARATGASVSDAAANAVTALWFNVLGPDDVVVVAPSFSPLLDAVHGLLGEDGPGSVGDVGSAAHVQAATATGRFIALVDTLDAVDVARAGLYIVDDSRGSVSNGTAIGAFGTKRVPAVGPDAIEALTEALRDSGPATGSLVAVILTDERLERDQPSLSLVVEIGAHSPEGHLCDAIATYLARPGRHHEPVAAPVSSGVRHGATTSTAAAFERIDAALRATGVDRRHVIASVDGARFDAGATDGVSVVEPAFALALDWMMCATSGVDTVVRLSSRTVDQRAFEDLRLRVGDEALRADILRGAYRLREPGGQPGADRPAVVIAATGSTVADVLAAAEALDAEGVAATVIEVTAPAMVRLEWRRDVALATATSRPLRSRHQLADLLTGDERRAPIVAVTAAGSAPLDWLGSVFGSVAIPVMFDGEGGSSAIDVVVTAALVALS